MTSLDSLFVAASFIVLWMTLADSAGDSTCGSKCPKGYNYSHDFGAKCVCYQASDAGQRRSRVMRELPGRNFGLLTLRSRRLRDLPVYVIIGCSAGRDHIFQWQDKTDFDYSNWAENSDEYACVLSCGGCFLQVNAQMAGAPWDDKYRLFHGKWYKRAITTDREDVAARAAVCQLVV